MKRLLTLVAFFATVHASAQQVNPVPDYVFRNQMSVGRNAVTDTAAYFSIGPRYGATKGFMPPIVGDTATFSSGKRNGLLIFSVQKNKFLYWDSVRVQWSDMAGSSGSYITGKGITGYVPQYTDTATLDTSALYTLGNQLGIGTSSFVYSGSGRTVVELNGTSGGLYGFKRNDSAKGYLFHNGDNMELANTVAGSISFNTNSATRGSIASDGVWRLNNLAGTGDRVVQASSNGTLSATASVTGLVDTLTISTRAWRQKGLDSLAALEVSGSGTTNYIPKFTAGSTIGNSQIQDNGSGVGIGVNPDSNLKLYVRPNSTTGTAIYSDNGANSGFVVKYNGAITNIGNDFNAPLALFTNDTERLRIFANGRVGINTTTDAGYQLDVNGTLRTTSSTDLASSGGEVRIAMADAGAYTLQVGGPVYFANAANTSLTTSAGLNYMAKGDNTYFTGFNFQGVAASDMFFGRTASSDDLVISTSNTGSPAERVRFKQNGDVGIGTNAPSYKLDINGTLRSVNGANFATTSGNVGIGTASPGAGLEIQRAGATDHLTFSRNTSAGNANVKIGGNVLALVFENNSSTELMRLNIAGELGIGTGATDAGDYKLQVSGNIYNTGSAVLAATSGGVTIGSTASPFSALDVYGAQSVNYTAFRAQQLIWSTEAFNASPNASIGFLNKFNTAGGYGAMGGISVGKENATDGNALGYMSFTTYGPSSLTEKMRITSSGNVGIGTASPAAKADITGTLRIGAASFVAPTSGAGIEFSYRTSDSTGYLTTYSRDYSGYRNQAYFALSQKFAYGTGGAIGLFLTSSGETLINTTTDAGDYKLQVVGNARVGTGKLDIASNTTFGLGVARSGTSEIAGQIYNSNGILYFGAESSTGGGIFSGSSAYAAVIGSGANYPLQFATNNATRATINTNGELLINTLTDNGDFKLQVNGNALISGSIKTANGGSSTAVPWHLGSVVATSVQLDTANYVEVEINGTFYRLAIVTPL